MTGEYDGNVDEWPELEAPLTDHIVHESDRRLVFACSAKAERIKRDWRKLPGEKIRHTEVEWMYDYPEEVWYEYERWDRDFEIDDDEALVGDGSGWSGEGMYWQTYAKERHEKLLSKRFPWRFR